MTTAATGNVAGQAGEKEKEKPGMRKALGRGLAALLPGPRMVTTAPAAPPHAVPAQTAGSVPDAPHSTDTPVTSGSVAPPAPPAPAVALDSVTRPGTAVPHEPAVTATALVAEDRGVETRVEGNTVTVVVEAPADAGGQPEAAVSTWPEEDAGPIEIQAVAEARIPGNLVVNLAIADIDRNPFQTRYVEDDEALEELAQSIKAQGLVQPIVVRPSDDDGRFTLILGERRLHASKKAGKTHIPALVRKVSAQQAAEMTIIENLQREDLSPLEQAQAFKVLSTEFNMTQQEIATRVGLSRESISNYMRLLRLPREVMEMLAEKRITFAKAKELLKLGENDRIAEAALYAVKKGMNLEQIEMLVLRMDGLLDPLPDMPGVQPKKASGGARWVDPNVRAAQVDLERTLGLRVRIRDRKGKGKIVIEYASVDDYERVVDMLRGRK